MIKRFSDYWYDVPTIFADTETTGVRAGHDRACQIGLVRFEKGVPVGEFVSLVNPQLDIPEAATAIHGITNEMVREAPLVEDVMARPDVAALLKDAQPAAYNATFDRDMLPPLAEDHSWPWLDALSLVRVVDKFVRGQGRHRLSVAAARHGVELGKAHDAGADAKAAGELFYKLAPGHYGECSLGELLRRQRIAEANDWARFCSWLAKQPPREVA